jgi:hypothetical protein
MDGLLVFVAEHPWSLLMAAIWSAILTPFALKYLDRLGL